jgi:nitroimidazol reductase NimA-like FMN-containing flavoprotein (pyridoxamine 5'-phosphate oxidase superfamily)
MTDAWLEELPYDVCLQRLREHTVGRIGVVIHYGPVVLPVNYRLVETDGLVLLAVRTRPDNLIDSGGPQAAFEIDDIDQVRQQGWSVLVRGTLHRVDPDAPDFEDRFDSHPWLIAERDAWLIIQASAITGRQLHSASREWAFHPSGYL